MQKRPTSIPTQPKEQEVQHTTDQNGRAHAIKIHASDSGDRGSRDLPKVNPQMETDTDTDINIETDAEPDLSDFDLVTDSGDFEVIDLFLAHRDQIRRGDTSSP